MPTKTSPPSLLSSLVSRRRAIAGATAGAAAGATAVLGVRGFALDSSAAPTMKVLGAGTGLSVLVESGDRRLLVATGDDAASFSHALAGARRLWERRIDVLVLAGGASDLAVAH